MSECNYLNIIFEGKDYSFFKSLINENEKIINANSSFKYDLYELYEIEENLYHMHLELPFIDYENKKENGKYKWHDKVYLFAKQLINQKDSLGEVIIQYINCLDPYDKHSISFQLKNNKGFKECKMPRYYNNKNEQKRMNNSIVEYDEFPDENYKYIREYGGTFFADERGEEDYSIWLEFKNEVEELEEYGINFDGDYPECWKDVSEEEFLQFIA